MAIPRRSFDPSILVNTTALAPVALSARPAYRARPMKPVFKPSEQQQAFFDWILDGKGNALLEAVAGAGKTTTLIEGLRLMDGSVFFGAYNKKISDEIKKKAIEKDVMRKGIYISTMHGVGYAAWLELHPRVLVDDRKVAKLVEKAAETDPSYEPLATFICRMVSFGKHFILGINSAADNLTVWAKLMRHFSVDQELPEDASEADINGALDKVVEIYRRSRECCDKVIDFDDMIFAPLYYKARFYRNDWVLIDECQDINPARRELAKRLLKPTGRLIAVGDSRQAIYGFCHPPGTLVKVPGGHAAIETLRVGDPVITSPVSGEVSGFSGRQRILETHKYDHSGFLLTLEGAGRKVTMTPHHKVPVQLDPDAQYYTYMMRSNGCYRVGYCAAYAPAMGMFMLMARVGTERADAAWLLAGHPDKMAARNAEARLLMRMKGTTFSSRTGDEVAALPTDEVEALKILGEHGRMVDFPLWTPKSRHRFARTGAIVTEACNLMDGMRFVFFDKAQCHGGKSGQRQRFVWTPFIISARYYSGPVYGITVPAARHTDGYQVYPLYFAGDNILVHNTGAGGDSVERIIEEFKCQRLPLTVTYRCPKAVVNYVHQWVSHIEAHPDAPEGEVRGPALIQPQPGQAAAPWFMQDQPGKLDAVLCRYTRPLIQTAFAMIRNGIACKVEGRDIGHNLILLATRWKITSLDTLEKRLALFLAREIAKARAEDSERKEQEIQDRVDTLSIFITRCREKRMTTIDALVSEIKALFADDVKDILTLSTGHKAKGREWPRVWWLQAAVRQRGLQDWEMVQETNINYVIGTRAMQELILVPEGTL